MAVVAAVLLAFFLVPLDGDRWFLGALVGTALLVLVVVLGVRRAVHIRSSPRPVLEAVVAIATVAVTYIATFASVFYVLADRDPDQFTGLATKVDALYFTVTTLATVGFGDVAPTGQAGRVLVTAAIVLNIVILGGLIRLLTASVRFSHQAAGQTTDPLA